MPAMDAAFQNLIASDRVGCSTREVLHARAAATAQYPTHLPADAFATLDAVTRRLVPQTSAAGFVDLAAGIDANLRDDVGDGWRYADLPSDREAMRLGLHVIDTLARHRHALAFARLDAAVQDELLQAIAGGDVESPGFDVRRWFEDLLAAAVEIYAAHPATLSRMGFSGVAFRPHWPAVGLGATGPWEPSAR